MLQTTAPGKMQEYISNIEFSLNFEDKKKSARVRVGDIVHFDGVTAKHRDVRTGEENVGRAIPLKSAVANNWLKLNTPGASVGSVNLRVDKIREDVPGKLPDYNKLTGGAFDEFLKEENITSSQVKPSKVTQEDDQIVKRVNFPSQSQAEKPAARTGKLEVSNDQVDVKSMKVSNSTSSTGGAQKTARMPVIQHDDGHADHIIISSKNKEPAKVQEKPKNSFTVDGSTPNLPADATMNEVRRAVTPIDFDESQDAQVVGKIGQPKMADEPNEVEGIVLKKTAFSKKASGSTPVADLSGVKTQAEVDHMEKGLDQSEVAKTSAAINYADMLPDNWSTLHWTKKEKFITQITDPKFVKYVMTVETAKVIQNACRKRLGDLEQSNG